MVRIESNKYILQGYKQSSQSFLKANKAAN